MFRLVDGTREGELFSEEVVSFAFESAAASLPLSPNCGYNAW